MKNTRTKCSESVTGRELLAPFANTMANAWVDIIDLQLEMHEWLTRKEAGFYSVLKDFVACKSLCCWDCGCVACTGPRPCQLTSLGQ